MRLYNASSSTPLALGGKNAKYKAPKNYLPDHVPGGIVKSKAAPFHGLSWESHLSPCSLTRRRAVSNSVSEIASNSSTNASCAIEYPYHAISSFPFDIDESRVTSKMSPAGMSDETFSRSTSSTISSLLSVDDNKTEPTVGSGKHLLGARLVEHPRPEVQLCQIKTLNRVNRTRTGASTIMPSHNCWEENATSSTSSRTWHAYSQCFGTNFRALESTHEGLGMTASEAHALFLKTRFSGNVETKHTHGHPFPQHCTLFPSKMEAKASTERKSRIRPDDWESFSDRFHRDWSSSKSSVLEFEVESVERTLGQGELSSIDSRSSRYQNLRQYGTDIRKHRIKMRDNETMTTCDTSNSSKESVRNSSRMRKTRRVPILLGHILEEKYQKARRQKKVNKIDEVGFPLLKNNESLILLLVNRDDESCCVATTFVRIDDGEWADIVSL